MNNQNNKMAPKRCVIGVEVEKVFREKLKELAKKKELSLSDVIRFALKDYVANEIMKGDV